ncbi:MAG: protein kinase [Deltaproteobacteria bacterium]|nr:protein kinase [Deltaproteobacteria bacterium]
MPEKEFSDDDDTASHGLPSLASDEILELLGGFSVVKQIGSGSTGRVFECIDTQSPPPEQGRHVVVKVLASAFAGEENLARLRRQTILLGGMHSHCVARVFGVSEHDGAPILIEELLQGENLQARLNREGKLVTRVALRAVRDAARGLRAAWDVGVVHGDVKPANLFFHDGRVKLDDFGLVPSPAGGGPSPAGGGAERGSMAADVLGLGRTLCALLSGKAFDPDKPYVIDDVVPASAAPPLRALLESLLAPEADQRPNDYDELVNRIEDTIAGKMTTTAPRPAPAPVKPPAAERPKAVALVEASPTASTVVRRIELPSSSSDIADPFATPSSSSQSNAGFVGAPTGVMGSLKQMSVTEIAQTLELGRKTARVELVPTNGAAGVFSCRAGTVVFAECGDVVGDEAFFMLAVHTDGFFRIHYGTDTDHQNISKPTQFLLLESMRRVDERHAASELSAIDAATVLSPLPVSLPTQLAEPAVTNPVVDVALPPAAQRVTAPPGAVSGEHWADMAATAPQELDAVHGFDDSRTVPSGEALPIKLKTPPVTDVVKRRPKSTWLEVQRETRRIAEQARDELLKRAPASAPHVAKVEAAIRAQPWLLAIPAVVGFLCFVVVVALITSSPSFSLAGSIAAIDQGKAHEVLEQLETPETPEQHLARGHALAAVHREGEALDAYRAAAAAKVVDERALEWVLGRLSFEAPDAALDLLQTWPDPTVHDRLVALTSNTEWRIRHNAATALRERTELTDDDQERIAIIDLTTSSLCPQRRDALVILKDLGTSAEAKAAIQEAAKTKKADNQCLASELTPALNAVSSRAKPKGARVP